MNELHDMLCGLSSNLFDQLLTFTTIFNDVYSASEEGTKQLQLQIFSAIL